MNSISSLMGAQKLLPIIQVENELDGVQLARAMYAANLTTVEVVLRSPRSAKAISAIKEALPDMRVCAGTIIDSASLSVAKSAGADFIVTPAVSDRLLQQLAECELPVLPGVASVSDVLLAREYGYTELKLFPAKLAGGAEFLKAIGSLVPDTRFCPTGGVSMANLDSFLSLDNVFAVGGTWVAKPEWVVSQHWRSVTDACEQAVRACDKF